MKRQAESSTTIGLDEDNFDDRRRSVDFVREIPTEKFNDQLVNLLKFKLTVGITPVTSMKEV